MAEKTLLIDRLKWVEEHQPSLAIHLFSTKESLPLRNLQKVTLSNEVKVAVIENAIHITEKIVNWLEGDRSLFLVFQSPSEILSYLSSKFFIMHPRIYLSLDSPYEFQIFFKEHLFLPTQFIGTLENARYYHDCVHMAASEYREYGKDVLCNIQRNLLHTKHMIDGRDLENSHKGESVILTGSGPSLHSNLEKLKQYKNSHVIIAAGSSLPTLLKTGIEPDYFLFIDPDPPLDIYANIGEYQFPIIYQNRMSSKLLQMHKGEKIWMGQSGAHKLESFLLKEAGIKDWIFDAGWHAGNFAHVVAKHFGFSHIYTVGMDGKESSGNSRRDLFRGLDWNEEFTKKFSIQVNSFDFVTEGKKRAFRDEYSSKSVKTENVQNAIIDLWNPQVLFEVNEFLKVLEKGIDSRQFGVETAIFESYFQHTPIYRYCLKEQWDFFSPMYLKAIDKEDPKTKIREVCFYKHAIETLAKDTRSLQGLSTGLIFHGKYEGVIRRRDTYEKLIFEGEYSFGKEMGAHKTYHESGRLLSIVYYHEGVKEGPYILYHLSGNIKRTGWFKKGLAHGKHESYDENGHCLDLSEYNCGVKCGTHRIYTRANILKEEMVFHTPDRFDKKLYDKSGTLTYEGLWDKDIYLESVHKDGKNILFRKAKWEKGGLVWES